MSAEVRPAENMESHDEPATTDGDHARVKKDSVHHETEVVKQRLAQTQKPLTILNPMSSRMQTWDGVLFVCLVFTAVVTPFEVGFSETRLYHPMFVINRIVDLVFVADIVVNFRLAFYDVHDRVWVYHPSRIRARYLRGWFGIDFVSVLPFDVIVHARVLGFRTRARATRGM